MSDNDAGQAQDLAMGGALPDPKGLPSPGELGSKVIQSGTLGFGADAAGAAFGKGAETSIRKLANQYDDKHPLAGIAIDLATATAWSVVPGLGEANDVKTAGTVAARLGKVAGSLGGRAVVAGGVGAAAGAGAGGDQQARTTHAMEGGAEGFAAGLGLGVLGKALGPILARVGPSQAKAAADSINSALAKEGKSADGLAQFLQKNPGARVADYSKNVADLVTKAVANGNDAARAAQKAVEKDAGQQQARMARDAQPMMKLKDDIRAKLDELGTDRNEKYNFAHTEIAPMTPELNQVLNSPSVKPHFDAAVKKLAEDKRMPPDAMGKKAAMVPKYNAGTEVPNYILDETQRGIENAIKEGAGTDTSGLMAARAMINKSAKPSLSDAQMAAARAQKAQDAQDWGFNYSKGLNAAPIDEFRKMGPAEQEFAKLGMANGLENFVANRSRMSEDQLRKLSDYVKHPAITEVLGKRNASQAAAVFRTEADRAKTSKQMLNGVSGRADYNEMASENAAAHIGNVATKAIIPAGGTLLRLASKIGMSPKQAQEIIAIAAKPGGLERLRKAKVDKNFLDQVQNSMKIKGAASGNVSQSGRQQSEN